VGSLSLAVRSQEWGRPSIPSTSVLGGGIRPSCVLDPNPDSDPSQPSLKANSASSSNRAFHIVLSQSVYPLSRVHHAHAPKNAQTIRSSPSLSLSLFPQTTLFSLGVEARCTHHFVLSFSSEGVGWVVDGGFFERQQRRERERISRTRCVSGRQMNRLGGSFELTLG
jgi:hypothetical protein